MTYGDVGGQLRIGKGLLADYGLVRVRPALSGTDYFDADKLDCGRGYYFFIGAQGRVVGHNIFLDGNTFRPSARVPKKTCVADLQAGFSAPWSSTLRLDFSVVRRTQEFVGQHGLDEVGTAALTFSWRCRRERRPALMKRLYRPGAARRAWHGARRCWRTPRQPRDDAVQPSS